jgi:hypothetical protein
MPRLALLLALPAPLLAPHARLSSPFEPSLAPRATCCEWRLFSHRRFFLSSSMQWSYRPSRHIITLYHHHPFIIVPSWSRLIKCSHEQFIDFHWIGAKELKVLDMSMWVEKKVIIIQNFLCCNSY